MKKQRAPSLARLRAARGVVAQLVLEDLEFAPVFERLEREVAAAQRAQSSDPLERARAALNQETQA